MKNHITPPPYHHLRIFGCLIYATTLNFQRSQFHPKVEQPFFMDFLHSLRDSSFLIYTQEKSLSQGMPFFKIPFLIPTKLPTLILLFLSLLSLKILLKILIKIFHHIFCNLLQISPQMIVLLLLLYQKISLLLNLLLDVLHARNIPLYISRNTCVHYSPNLQVHHLNALLIPSNKYTLMIRCIHLTNLLC